MKRIEGEVVPSFKKVLIIESNPQLKEILSTYLNFSGMAQDITTANSLAAAQGYLEKAKASKQPPQLILTELQLGDGDSLAFLAQLKAENSPLARIPIVVMTGADDPMIKSYCIAHGACAVLEKPFALSDLEQQVKQVFSSPNAWT